MVTQALLWHKELHCLIFFKVWIISDAQSSWLRAKMLFWEWLLLADHTYSKEHVWSPSALLNFSQTYHAPAGKICCCWVWKVRWCQDKCLMGSGELSYVLNIAGIFCTGKVSEQCSPQFFAHCNTTQFQNSCWEMEIPGEESWGSTLECSAKPWEVVRKGSFCSELLSLAYKTSKYHFLIMGNYQKQWSISDRLTPMSW